MKERKVIKNPLWALNLTKRRLLLTSYFSWMKCITWVGSQDLYWFCLNFLFVFFPCWLVGFPIFIWRKTEKNITMALPVINVCVGHGNFAQNDIFWDEYLKKIFIQIVHNLLPYGKHVHTYQKQLETKIYSVRTFFKCLGRVFLGISHFTGECANRQAKRQRQSKTRMFKTNTR